MWKVHLPLRIICRMLHVFSKQRHEFPPPSQGKLGAIDASCLPLPSFNCSFSHSHSPFSVLPLLVVATQITLCKEKERKCESAGQTYFTHTHSSSPSLHTLLTYTHFSSTHTHSSLPSPSSLLCTRSCSSSLESISRRSHLHFHCPFSPPSPVQLCTLSLVTWVATFRNWQLHWSREADRDKDRDRQHSPASVNAILCRLFAVLPFLFLFPSADYLITSCRLTTLAIVKFRFAKGNAYNYSKLIVAQWYVDTRLQRIEVTVLKQLRCVCIKPWNILIYIWISL